MNPIRSTRRDIMRAAGAGAALSLAGITGAAAAPGGLTPLFTRGQDDGAELTWAINAQSGTEIDLVQSVVDAFVAENPGFKVTVLNYDPITYDQKLLTDISAGTMPDLFVSADVFTKPFFDSGLTADLIPLAAETGFDLETFDEKFLALGEYDGKLGFLPRAADVVVLYFNKEMFDAAGVEYPTDEWTWTDLLAAAEKLTIKNADGATTQYGLDAAYSWWAIWVPLVVAEGGRILSDDNTEAVFNSEEGMRAWGYLFEGLTNGWFMPPSAQEEMGGAGVGFSSGNAAMTMTVRAVVPTLRSQLEADWDVQLVPKGTVARSTGMGAMGYAISSQSKDPSAAWKLMEYTYTDGMKFFMESYLVVPPITTFYDDPAWRDLPGPPYNNEIFVTATEDAMLPPPLPFYSTGNFRKAMEDGIDAVLLGQMSPEDAVNNMAMEGTRALQMG